MFEKNEFDARLLIAAQRFGTDSLWAARFETTASTPVRTGGITSSHATRDTLLMTSAISAVGSLPRRRYAALLAKATGRGADRPRLELSANPQFLDGLKGADDVVLRVSPDLHQTFSNIVADRFELAFAPELLPLSLALLSWARRSLRSGDFSAPRIFQPQIISAEMSTPITPATEGYLG